MTGVAENRSPRCSSWVSAQKHGQMVETAATAVSLNDCVKGTCESWWCGLLRLTLLGRRRLEFLRIPNLVHLASCDDSLD